MSQLDESRTGPSVAVSEERFVTVASRQGAVDICFQTFGEATDPALLLVMGLGGPMTWWDPDFCRLLAGQGFHVIRFDNRDTGRSSRVVGRVSRAGLARSFVGRAGPPP